MNNIALLSGSFHASEIVIMRKAATAEAESLGLTIVEDVAVPGSMEKPLALRWLLASSQIDGVAVLGIIEKGETAHGLVMAQAVIAKIVELQLEFEKPVGVGILGPEVQTSQIPSRLECYARAAVRAVSRMFEVKLRLSS